MDFKELGSSRPLSAGPLCTLGPNKVDLLDVTLVCEDPFWMFWFPAGANANSQENICWLVLGENSLANKGNYLYGKNSLNWANTVEDEDEGWCVEVVTLWLGQQ